MARARRELQTVLRIALLTLTFVGPVGAFAMANANTGGQITGAGLVLYVTLQRG